MLLKQSSFNFFRAETMSDDDSEEIILETQSVECPACQHIYPTLLHYPHLHPASQNVLTRSWPSELSELFSPGPTIQQGLAEHRLSFKKT